MQMRSSHFRITSRHLGIKPDQEIDHVTFSRHELPRVLSVSSVYSARFLKKSSDSNKSAMLNFKFQITFMLKTQ